MSRSRIPVVVLLVACGSAASDKSLSEQGDGLSSPGAGPATTLPDVTTPDLGSPPGDPVPAAPTRQRKRMTVAQVRDSMEQITGGIPWSAGDGSDWDTYAATLGVADYQQRTLTDRTPGVLFQKFLDDAAVETCTAWVAGAGTAPFFPEGPPESSDPDAVRGAIRALRWTIQGRARDGDAPMVESLATLFASALRRTDNEEAAWTTVCVGLFTHPDFFMY